MEELKESARIVAKDCLAIKEGEQVLIVVDEPKRKIANAIFEASKELGAEVILMEMIPRDNHGQEPPKLVAKAMKFADVVIMPTSKSLSHTQARIEANQAGARAATMPDITEEMMKRALNADYKVIKERGNKITEKLSTGKEVRVTAPNGTDIRMLIEGREGHPDTGIYHQTGEFGNLPAGESYIAPLEGKSQGKFIVDGSMAEAKVHTEEIELLVEDGYVTEIKGKAAARNLRKIIEPYGKDAKNIAELGIGTNDQAELTGNILEDEKVLGTVHIAIGDNSAMGGNISVDSHLDGIIENPTVEIDGDLIMKDGKLLID
ncbi:aminopeptidase [Orenia marismortui]|uniref:Leucyl aminopeptidase (Aminopeptidase T) n=1 Tax=Orenia marismortui TaxID=46469 RepID=A0A4R8GDX0_9FIRM|nr:aminopeptidase [Orenia marismortui]TDX43696.1 leucyl aminopeptidase (aminopeptidase T) [Orenia marismortui]